MSDDDDESPSDVQAQLDELTATLEALQSELERSQRRRSPFPRPPSAEELRRFTSDVAIPGLIILLEANVRALKLLRRTIRVSDRDGASEVQERASQVGATAMSRLESALEDVQGALEGQPSDGEAQDLLADARRLREDIQERLDEAGARTDGTDEQPARGPEVDVEAELQSIKDQMDDDDDDEQDS